MQVSFRARPFTAVKRRSPGAWGSGALLVLGLSLASASLAAPRSGPGTPRAPAAIAGSAAAGTGQPAWIPSSGDIARGREKADSERCIECHGLDGQAAENGSGTEGKFARLAGQHADYLLKQLSDFRSGARKHDVMSVMASTVEPADLKDIVAYFSSLPRMAGDGVGDHPAGQKLFTQGDASRGIPACAGCHGDDARGKVNPSATAPMLGGQAWLYLERQLLDWRAGWRRNSAGQVMNHATRALSDQDIKDLSSHLSIQR